MCFWPDFISTTSSTGTRILPNLSCMPARAMRSCSARWTDFSNPEYACTTYQRFGIADLLASEWVPITLFPPLLPPSEDQVVQHPLEGLVRDLEEEGHHHHESEHRGGRLQGLLARRPDDLLYLGDGLAREGEEVAPRRVQRRHRGAGAEAGDNGEQAHDERLLAEPVVGHDARGDEHRGDRQLGDVDDAHAVARFSGCHAFPSLS